jgi:hypothetical protein
MRGKRILTIKENGAMLKKMNETSQNISRHHKTFRYAGAVYMLCKALMSLNLPTIKGCFSDENALFYLCKGAQ